MAMASRTRYLKPEGAYQVLGRARELEALSYILPQLDSAKEEGQVEQEVHREHIFTTLAQFIPKVVDSQALIVFIDDLHLSDEATLLLLRQLVLQGDIPLFI